MPVFAQCTQCGREYESRFWQFSDSQNISMWGNTEPCPFCGGRARTMEGRFDFRGDRPVLIEGPQWSRDMLDRFRRNLQDIQRVADSRKYTDDEARAKINELLEEIAESNPVVADEYRKRAKPTSRKSWKWAAAAVAAALIVADNLNTVVEFTERVADAWEFFSARAGSAVVEVHDPPPDDGWRLPEREA